MSKFKMLPQDIPAIDPKTGKWTADWYDLLKGLERLGVLDMADVDNSTPITNTQVLVYDGTAKKLKPGAN